MSYPSLKPGWATNRVIQCNGIAIALENQFKPESSDQHESMNAIE